MNMKIITPQLLSHRVFFRKKFMLERGVFDAWYLLLVASGSFEVNILGKHSIVRENEICIFPPNVYFERHVLEPLYHQEIILKFNDSEEEMKNLGQYFVGKISVSDFHRTASTIENMRILNEVRWDNMELFQHYLTDLWYQIVLEKLSDSQTTHRHLQLNGTEIDDEIVKKSIVYFNEYMDQKIVINQLAAELGVTASTFCRRFEKCVGISPGSYLMRMRVQKARVLLLDTSTSINIISEMCGFDNQFYFSNCFKKYIGVSPLKYRQSSGVDIDVDINL